MPNGCNDNCQVNTQLTRLRGLAKPIKTFVVGFAFSSTSGNLNCNAVHAGTSLCASNIDASNCNSSTVGPCYHNANTPAALVQALTTISAQISGCTFDMDQAPPDINQLYVFTRDLENGSIPPGATYDPVPTQVENPASYYTLNGLRIQLFGQVCEDVRNGLKKPVIIYGCPRPGG